MDREAEFRRRWYEAHVSRYLEDEQYRSAEVWKSKFRSSAAEALVLRDELLRTGDVAEFGAAMQAWSAKPTTLAFNNPIGQMLINQLVKRCPDPAELATVLGNAISQPLDDADAHAKLQALVDYVESIRVGAHPAPSRVPFVLSYFWALEQRERWPVIWPSAANFIEYVIGQPLPSEPARRYAQYVELVRSLDQDYERFEGMASWWEEASPVFLDSVLVDRCAYGVDATVVDLEDRMLNAAALVSAARHIGTTLADELSRVANRTLAAKHPPRMWTSEYPRADMFEDWLTLNGRGPGIRLWVNHHGASIGLHPGNVRSGWKDEAAAALATANLPGFRLMAAKRSTYGEDVGHEGGQSGMFTYAKWYEPSQISALDLRAEVAAVTEAVRPLLDRLLELATGVKEDGDDPLHPVVEWFLARGYPTPADEEHKADRARFAEILAADNIALVDASELRQVWTTSRYGNPGPQAALNTTLRDATDAEYDHMIDALTYLCWGEDDDAVRIDAVLSGDQYKVRGLGESVVMKFLAISHPERYIPVYPYSGPKGKRRMLQLLGLEEPSGDTRGQLLVRANDLLRNRLDRHFPGDPWGMAQFLYRYAERDTEPTPDRDPLQDVADELLVDRSFLEDIVALLEDKGQVILYGPPGTGKTYLAQKLAEALAPDPTRRSLVQFHPSTSYEDFFEGYRPETDSAGAMTYRLTQGPLAMIAERARDAPGKRHIMIIDEINRANLPKVLGELLFLLEYRDQSVRTLYRPDDAFDLPADLWFIGTMNTADRSIALIDAALRRRFHFIPFFPNHGAMRGLLDRWLAEHQEPAWVGELVAMVNDELVVALGGPHLQLGPSHFMKAGLDEERLHRIWRYNIEPFIEDQFFGDSEQIDRFRFERVLARYHDEVGVGAHGVLEDEAAAGGLTSGVV